MAVGDIDLDIKGTASARKGYHSYIWNMKTHGKGNNWDLVSCVLRFDGFPFLEETEILARVILPQ